MRSTEFDKWLQSVSRPPRFLIVEDDHLFTELVEKTSEKYDVIVEVARSVEEAIELLCANKFRLIILDCKLPGRNGLELVRHMHAHKIRLPVVVLSGHIEQRMINEASELGLVAWVAKPARDVIEQLHDLFRLLNVKERMPGLVE